MLPKIEVGQRDNAARQESGAIGDQYNYVLRFAKPGSQWPVGSTGNHENAASQHPTAPSVTRTTTARVAGFAFIIYIVAGLGAFALSTGAARLAAAPGTLAAVGEHVPELRVSIVLSLVASFCALVLGATLYSLTSDEDRELAMIAFASRVGEGIIGILPVPALMLLWLPSAVPRIGEAAAHPLALLVRQLGSWTTIGSAILFSAGSLIFAVLFARGRLVPRPLALLGVFASALLLLILPLQLGGAVTGLPSRLAWLPMLVFEVVLAFWLIVRGVAASRPTRAGAVEPGAVTGAGPVAGTIHLDDRNLP
jgi:hypothetical protein